MTNMLAWINCSWRRWGIIAVVLVAIPGSLAGYNIILDFLPWPTKPAMADQFQKITDSWKRQTDSIVNRLDNMGKDVRANGKVLRKIQTDDAIQSYDQDCGKAYEAKLKGHLPDHMRRRLEWRYRVVLSFKPNFPRCDLR